MSNEHFDETKNQATEDQSVTGFENAATPEAELQEIETVEDFSAMVEESLRNLEEGEVTKGHVIEVTKDFVMVDIGAKSEGQIDINEFASGGGAPDIMVGDVVDVLLERRED